MNIERLKEVSRIFCEAEAELIKILSEEKPDPYAELKEAQAQGKEIQQVGHGSGDWFNCGPDIAWNRPVECYRIKPEEPWTLTRHLPGFRALRDGEEWSNHDRWTKATLDGGWRPLFVGERGSYELSFDDGKTWQEGMVLTVAEELFSINLRRTKRPLPILTPQQVADGWKEWHGGENPVPGKKVEIILRDETNYDRDSCELHWLHFEDTDDIIAYRVIEPKLVQLGPDDVRCGDEVKYNDSGVICSILRIQESGVNVFGVGFETFDSLMTNYTIRRRDSEIFTPCSKEEKQ